MDEREIKARVLAHLRDTQRISRGDIIASEFSVPHLSVRADLAILGGSLLGIEIKSPHDSTRRLASQLPAYRKCFDETILVLATKHMTAKCRTFFSTAEVWEISADGLICEVTRARGGQAKSGQSLLALLTKSELRRFYRPSRENLSDENSDREARAAFAQAFSARYEKTSNRFWEQTEARNPVDEDINCLSRFREQRNRFDRWKQDRSRKWDCWLEQGKPGATDSPFLPQSSQGSSVSYNPISSP